MQDDSLIGFVEQISGEVHRRVEENLGNGFVRLRSAEAERRQAAHDIRRVEDMVIEMLRNARDAGARQIYVATTREGKERSLTVIDNGAGIPTEVQQAIFEPRVTSKLDTMVMDDWGVHGRGMALYSIACNALQARVLCSAPQLGAAFFVEVDTEKLPERTDQSTLPTLGRGEDGSLEVLKGPHNIARIMVEFALSAEQAVEVYLGSPAQVAATLLEQGQKSLRREDVLFKDAGSLPLVLRLATAADSGELEQQCAALGLGISERTAHRILAGQITPLRPLLKAAHRGGLPTQAPADTLLKDTRGLRIAREDANRFARALEQAFEVLGNRYYLSLTKLPSIRVMGNSITVRFSIEKE